MAYMFTSLKSTAKYKYPGKGTYFIYLLHILSIISFLYFLYFKGSTEPLY